jgi:hypothetical protein
MDPVGIWWQLGLFPDILNPPEAALADAQHALPSSCAGSQRIWIWTRAVRVPSLGGPQPAQSGSVARRRAARAWIPGWR